MTITREELRQAQEDRQRVSQGNANTQTRTHAAHQAISLSLSPSLSLCVCVCVCVCVCEQYGAEIEKLRESLAKTAGEHSTAMAQVSWNGAGREGVSEGMGRWVH